MLCKNCHYPLKQLTEPRCPECGLVFDPNDSSTYLVQPDRKSRRLLKLFVLGVLIYVGVFVLLMRHAIADRQAIAELGGPVVNNFRGVTLTVVQETIPLMFFRVAIMAMIYWPVAVVVVLVAFICLRRAISSVMLRIRLARKS